jgi:hypothetical protein
LACIAGEDGKGVDAPYPFFFGRILLSGLNMPRVSKEVAAAGAAGLAVFGLRVSRLPRFCPLAMLLSSDLSRLKTVPDRNTTPHDPKDLELYERRRQRLKK